MKALANEILKATARGDERGLARITNAERSAAELIAADREYDSARAAYDVATLSINAKAAAGVRLRTAQNRRMAAIAAMEQDL